MNFDFLPDEIKDAVILLNTDKLNEIRLRKDYPIKCLYNGKISYLSVKGITEKKENSIICTKNHITEIIDKLTQHSLYAFNEDIKNGFLIYDKIRIGLSGKCIKIDDKISTITEFSSLNIRFPHIYPDCSLKIFNMFYKEKINNLLIISPPCMGKTTILRDLIYQINKKSDYQLLIIDERNELNVSGENIDTISNSDKKYAFDYGIRSMSPNIVFFDELCDKDWLLCKNAVNSGVNIVATIHANNYSEVVNKSYFLPNIFNCYVELDNKPNIGHIKNIGTINI